MELLTNDKQHVIVDSGLWGPLLVALGNQNLVSFRFLTSKYRFNLYKELILDIDSDIGDTNRAQTNEILPFYLATTYRHIASLEALLDYRIGFMWKPMHIQSAAQVMKSDLWADGLVCLIESTFVQTMFLALKSSVEGKEAMVESFFISL